MKFIDEVTVYCRAGKGGNGCVAWRREAMTPMGGPSGGDGGNGGNVVFVADEGLHSLLDHKYNPHIRAQSGEDGQSKNCFGKKGEATIVKVPVGTQVFDKETGELLHDFTEPDVEVVLLKGGSGGHGNARFVTSTRQAPDFAKPGLPGEEKTLRLSLKLLADVGLLGFPNAGKSTFLSRVSAARPKIADYPFTTINPQLGVVQVEGYRTFVMADVPGLIEGASEGAGLGHRFLKHLERVRVLCHLIEAPIDYGQLYPQESDLSAEDASADDDQEGAKVIPLPAKSVEVSIQVESTQEGGSLDTSEESSVDSSSMSSSDEGAVIEMNAGAGDVTEAELLEAEVWDVGEDPDAVHIPPPDDTQALVEKYEALRRELAEYSDTLSASPEVVVLNKAELIDDKENHPQVKALREHLDEKGVKLLYMSAASGEGVQDVVKKLWGQVVREKPSKAAPKEFDPYAKMR